MDKDQRSILQKTTRRASERSQAQLGGEGGGLIGRVEIRRERGRGIKKIDQKLKRREKKEIEEEEEGS